MNLFYDSIILLYLLASATLAVGLFRDRNRKNTWESRHPTITIAIFIFLCSSILVMLWGSFIEPRLITINRVSLDLSNFEPTRPVRVALISDIQVGDYKKGGWVRKVTQRIAQEKPDLVLLAGDIIQRKTGDTQYLSAFSILHSSFPTYAVLGDHDYHVNQPHFKLDQNLADTVHQALTAAGVQVLHNETRAIEMQGAQFTLIGLDDWLAHKTDFTKAISYLPNHLSTDVPKIVLVHNPDFILAPESKNADLILAGNTHGGQIRLPFIGPVARLPSELPPTFDEGLFTVHNHTRLFITSGIGESGPRARLFNPPEIVLLELR